MCIGNIDTLTADGIKRYLSDEYRDFFNIHIFDKVESTNTLLRQLAENGAEEGTVVLASAQSAGRGRKGRTFISPENTGLYMSILLKPSFAPSEVVMITPAAAVATSRAIEKVTSHNAKIKWVNDIFINDRKVCGILTEASVDALNGSINYVVLGIGVNVYTPENGFDYEIENIAGSISRVEQKDLKNRLVSAILCEFMPYFENLGNRNFLEEYISRSCVLGRKITVYKPCGKKTAVATEINENCHLKVRYSDGSTEYLSSGEISIKL